jgi:MFS family permease
VNQTGGAIGAIDLAPATPTASKNALRASLRASTLDGVFATVFSNGVGGVLLSNFLIELHASPTEIGLLSSIPMLANLIQPIGAVLSERTTSRHNYSLWIYGPSRLLWLVLVAGIALSHWHTADPQVLVRWTLAIVCVTHFIGALGSASWLSWLAVLVPRRLRGRYFGIRNSAASLTSLLCVPLLGWMVSAFPAGSIAGYGVVLLLAIVAGVISIGFQFFMVDVNPQTQSQVEASQAASTPDVTSPADAPANLEAATASSSVPALHDRNFLVFLLYLTLWTFAVNLSAPFFNLYLLDNLAIDLQAVTIYNSLQSGANLLLLLFWGQLADRVGNRAVLLGVGILVAATPLLWLGTSADSASVWLWFPLLHILGGGTWAAIDLCNNNLQLGVAPLKHQTHYFAIAAAVAGVSGALGTTTGGLLVEFADYGGIPGLFALSAIVRLGALLPLLLVQEQRGQSLRVVMGMLFPGSGEVGGQGSGGAGGVGF